MLHKLFRTTLLASLFCLMMGLTAFAQGTTSRLTGIITDQAGAPVSGASVTITNQGTSAVRSVETGQDGGYVFDLIQPGVYTVSVEKSGFKKIVSKNNTALVNQPLTVNVSLEIGDLSAVVEVTNSAEQVQTSTSGNIGSTIETRTLEALPIVGTRGRNPLDLLNFQPGVVFGGNTGGAVNVNGSRDRAFNFTLDGIDINESTAGGSNFTPLRANPDSIQEVQIVTSNFTAELGRSSGAQVSLVSRSGTNNFRGNLFEYYQTPRFNAKSYASTIANTPKEQFVQHIYGGSFGGPLPNFGFGEGTPFRFLKDRAFFFVNVQFLRAYDTGLVTRTVYTPAARTGLYRYVVGRANAPAGTSTASVDGAGNVLLPACTGTPPTNSPCINSYNIATQAPVTIDPLLQAYINAMPAPNNYTVGDGLNTAGFNFASPQHERQYDLSTKFNFNINDKNTAYIRWAQGSQSSLGDSANGGRPIFPDSPNFVDTGRKPRNLAANWTWSPTATTTNELIYGHSRFFFSFATPEPDPALPFAFLNVATANTNFSYNARGVKAHQFVDNLTMIRGSHTLKAGTNIRSYLHTDDRSSVGGSAIEPVVTFSTSAFGYTGYNLPASGATSINAADLTRLQSTIADLLGRIGTISQAFIADPNNPNTFLPAGSRWLNRARYNEYDFYFQDSWRARKNLVFDLGVRWEIKQSPKSLDRPTLVPDQPVKLGAAPSNTLKWVEGKLFDTDYSKVMPSIGFAWDPFKSGKTSIRGNYRLASDRIATFLFGSFIYQNTLGNALGATNAAFGQSGGLYRNITPIIPTLIPTQTPAQARQPAAFGALSTNVIDPDLQFPQIHSWSASFQREMPWKTVLEVNYIGKHGVHLLGGYNINQVNIFATDPRCGSQTFLQAFIQASDATNTSANCLATLLTSTSGAGGSQALFRTQFASDIANGNVATSAQTLARRSGTTSLTANGFSPFFLQPFPQFNTGLNVFDSNDYSRYDGLQFIFKRRMTQGIGFQFAYTLSKSKDNRSWDPSLSGVSTGSVQSASSTPFDLRDRGLNYTYSDFDRRHVFQGTYVFELPFGEKRWLKTGNGVVDYLIGGWQLSGTAIYMSGRPFTVYSGKLTMNNIVQSTANCSGCTRNIGTLVLESGKNFWFDAATRALFTAPAPGEIGNTGRNYFIAPVYTQMDASLLRKFRFTERLSFDLRIDARNMFNHPSFDNPTAVINSTIFGRINDSVTNAARRMQFSGKLNF